MSDKSFGDHMSRGIVKNPLLSTAVTGLSIEDLTQNAVLLPVSRTQELFGRQEHGAQNVTLAHEITPSGDASFTPIHPPDAQQNAKNKENTQKDDFDVNEYFARLQGTIYVSAPINSHLKEDTNTNIDTKEDNLEEINLNEPTVLNEDVQQSLTADIAQNFSQLPTVLPQVASAVFSSFSNMLNMKSREHTPDEAKCKTPVYAQPQEVPLVGVGETREVAPPPKEPPLSGPGNFRLTTKKKYAQIPGLSSGETGQMPTYTPPSFNQPIFTPPQQEINDNFKPFHDGQSNVDFNVFSNTAQSIPVKASDNQPNVFETPKEDASNFVATPQLPQDYGPQAAIIPPPPMFSNLAKKDSLPNVGKTILPPSVARRIASNKPTISNHAPAFARFDNIFVPEPVVADTETSSPPASQTFVPTLAQTNQSLATSFSSNYTQGLPPQPGMPSTPMPPTNVISSGNVQPNASLPASPVVQIAPETTSQVASSISMPTNVPSTAESSFMKGNLPPTPTNAFVATPAVTSYATAPPIASHAGTSSIVSPLQSSQTVAPPTMFIPENKSQTVQNIPPPTTFSNESSVTASTSKTSDPPQMFNPYLQDQSSGLQSDVPAQTIASQPTARSQMLHSPNQHASILKLDYQDTLSRLFPTPPVAETPKITEPPKASGNTNFRMTKKRPQYYSGPIEGVGAISNNIKPTLTPVATAAFQGSVFTPEANTGYQPAVFSPENVTETVASSSRGAIFTPPVTVNQNQSSIFSPIGVNVDTAEPFSLNKPVENVDFTPFDINKAPESEYASYNSAFDMSRQATDTFEPPKQESAFAIIGSLKSKLSSIDINKLQNSLTTFFDPEYNAAKTEASKTDYGQNQGIEIFVANPETHPQPYNYDAHQASFTYGQGSIPNASDYYNQQVHNIYSTNSYYSEPSYGTASYSWTDLKQQQENSQRSNYTYDPTVTSNTEYSQTTNVAIYQPTVTSSIQDDIVEYKNGNNFVGCEEVVGSADSESVDTSKAEHLPDLFQNQLVNNEAEKIKPREEENVDEAMKKLDINEDLKANLEQISLIEDQVALNNTESENPVNKLNAVMAFFDIEQKNHEISFSNMLEKTEEENQDYMLQQESQLGNMFSAPLHDLTVILADKSNEIADGAPEVSDDVSWNSNEDEADEQSTAEERLLALENSSDEDSYQSDSGKTTDFNMCETCREVKQPEEKDADFTSQLIENITAPIQLSNPVEVPLTETHSAEPDCFDTINQLAEIALIADETIETLQIQSATELLEKNENTNIEKSYGWRTEVPLPLGQDLLDHDYSFKANPNAIGFFANNNLFFDNIPNNASDEIKAEFKVSQDEPPLLLQRQISIPTAPPAEDSDDAKSDETGVLDVQSIEQDASKDFPVFEEYVIEPSETDDDKIEVRDKIDEVKDTFTNRVDRFKKLEGSDDAIEQKDFDSAISNTKIPSYFDTGNYAVETHFKNSLTSPTITRIPPGFEDHYELMPNTKNTDVDKQYEPIKVPETSTQTKPTTTICDVHTKTAAITSMVFSKVAPVTPEPQLETRLPDFSSVFGPKIDPKDTCASGTEKAVEAKDHTRVNPQVTIEGKVDDSKLVTLPDPINFFASSTEKTDAVESVNRLASYFTSPAKTDNTKSFFELSQGQNHYRQDEDKIEGRKTFFELSQSQDHYKENKPNIPHDRYIANLNLINDLTSCQNIEPTKEQVVRTINYCTVEYDNSSRNFNKGDPSFEYKQPDQHDRFVNEKEKIEKEETVLNHDENLIKIVNKCKYCRDFNVGPVFTVRETEFDSIGNVRFRQAMDTGGSKATEGVNMQTEREEERSVGVKMEDVASDRDSSEGVAMMTENRSSSEYEPVKHHWFYRVDCEEKSTWRGFSTIDSRAIENAFLSPDLDESTLVPTDGGRYDVNVLGRLRTAVYWADKPTNVRRCSWFYKGTTDARYVPYSEAVAEKLEVEYRHGITTGEWHRRLVLPNSELVVMHGPAVMVHFLQGGSTDAFSAPNLFSFGKRVYRNPPKFKVSHDLPPKIDHLLLLVHGAGEWRHQKDKIQSTMRPRVVRRGIDESEIEDTEPSSIDHLLLLCHGVGSACDMRFRAVEEVVDDFRATSLQLLQSHYRNSCDNGVVGRVEVLPISWHASLHAGPKGVDRRLARVTLASIPRLRNFTNDTVLDVLFYTSPHYCQMILDTVCGELNRIYTLFMKRNPDFKGEVSLGGHSLGSVILYDLLCNQPVPRSPLKERSEKTYLSGTAANNPSMEYPRLCFEPLALYALGSPIAIFECIRGVESLGSEFYLPTCRNFFNIFHPYDPIAYRIEPLVNPQLQNVKPSLIPHHKGRKRMHLELKDTMARVGADLKQKLVESIRSTWSSMWASAAPPDHQLEKVVEEEIEKEQLEQENAKEEPAQADMTPGELLGRLNGGRRVDYVLQEAPFEMINEYLFAMSSHVCYWESEDVMLLILREIYDSMGVQPDVTVPQQSMSVQRVTVVRDGEKIVVNPADPSTSRVA